jgi:hypothetical protein
MFSKPLASGIQFRILKATARNTIGFNITGRGASRPTHARKEKNDFCNERVAQTENPETLQVIRTSNAPRRPELQHYGLHGYSNPAHKDQEETKGKFRFQFWPASKILQFTSTACLFQPPATRV